MMIVMVGGLIVIALGAIAGAVRLWWADGYGAVDARATYDSRRPHPTDAVPPDGR